MIKNILLASISICFLSACEQADEKQTSVSRSTTSIEETAQVSEEIVPIEENKTTEEPIIESESVGEKAMAFAHAFHDFGRVKKDGIVKHTYPFTNKSREDLVIVNHHVTCGCTIPEYAKNEIIKAGTTSEVVVGFNTAIKSPNIYNKTVTFNTNQGDFKVDFKVDLYEE